MSLSALAKTLIQGAQDAGETLASYPVSVAGAVSNGVIRSLRVTDDGRLETVPVSSSGGQPSYYVASGVVGSGASGTAAALNAGVTLDLATVNGGAMSDGVTITTSGTWVGTITYYVSYDGTNFVALNCVVRGAPNTGIVTTRTANATVFAQLTGALKVRAEFSAYTSGTATILIVPTSASGENGVPVQPMIGAQTQISTSGIGDANTGSQTPTIHQLLFNATTFDRQRSANGSANTSGTGLLGVHPLAYDGTNYQLRRNLVGSQANAWNNAATGVAGSSSALEMRSCDTVTFFGISDGATTFTFEFSQDNSNWYDSDYTLVLAANREFGITIQTAARYVRVKSSANVTVTAALAGKGA